MMTDIPNIIGIPTPGVEIRPPPASIRVSILKSSKNQRGRERVSTILYTDQ
jgi:hypothetical protein